MQIKSIRVIFVLVVVGITCGMLYLRFFYFDERGRQESLIADVNCADVLPSDLELQGKHETLSAAKACSILKSIGKMSTLQTQVEDTANPWRYFGRARIKLNRDVWFIVFRARKMDGYKPQFALRHWKGSGWTIIGDFDAMPLLIQLTTSYEPDIKFLESPESLIPTDQSEPM